MELEEYVDEIFESESEANEVDEGLSSTASELSEELSAKTIDVVIDSAATTNFKQDREQIISNMVGLAGVISSIVDYPTKTLLLEVSKIARDQMLNENIKPDYGAFRVQLFKYIWKYSNLAERKTKIFSSILIDLYRNEFQTGDIQFSRFQDLTQNEKNSVQQENQDVQLQPPVQLTPTVKRKDVVLALKALLAVFAKFSSPKTTFREPEIRMIYNELLLSSDPELQKVALSCLSSYKEDFLLPYMEHLYNLLNENKFRDELVLFTVDEQNCIVSEEHRIQLMPIVMRILYGRFHTHVTVRGKARRMAIFAFLASCNADEMEIFFRLVFSTFETMFVKQEDGSLNLMSTLNGISGAYNPRKTLPLNKIRSTLGMLDDVIKRMAFSLNESQISMSFAVCLISGVLVNHGLDFVETIEGHAANSMLKSLRKQTFNTLIKLFHSFQSRNLGSDKLESVFDLLLVPMISSYNFKLSSKPSGGVKEMILQVSVVKLFISWANSSKLFNLLQKQFNGELMGQTPISLMCNTLSNAGTPFATQSAIIRGILNMLVSDDASSKKECSEGTKILLPNVVKILQYVAQKIPSNAKSLKIPSSYLEILNRLSIYIEDAHLGSLFTSTLLSYLGNKQIIKKKEKLINVMNTVTRLSSHVQDPLYHLRKIARLLSALTDYNARNTLIQLISSLKSNLRIPTTMKHHVQLLEDLESWDPKRIEEPDAERRHKAFEKLQQEYESSTVVIDLEMLQLFVHSHAYCILHLSSLSLKKSSSDALRQMVFYLQATSSITWEAKSSFLQNHFISLLLKGVNSTNEMCRIEFLQCLGALISAFPEMPNFASLLSLNQGQEGESFLENMMHIQVHRRQRALFRLTEQLNKKELDVPYGVLLKFVWPTFKPYLLETNSKLSALADQSLKLFSAILKITPWKRYCEILDQHIPKIDDEVHTKGAIRVVSAILDSFHFDLSKCKLSTVKLLQSNEEEASNGNKEEETNLVMKENDNLYEKEQYGNEDDMLVVVIRKLLPQLRHYSRPKHNSFSHKKAQSNVYSNDEESLVRAPILLATVKLLKFLPKWAMDQNLHSILASMSQLLLSRSISVRQDSRKIMGQVIQSLDPPYLPFVIKELKQTMNKGYQVHIMIFTVHTIIAALENKMTCGDLDACLEDIFEICKIELFSQSTEEKQNKAVKVNIPEAKSNKVLETYTYIGRFVSSKHLDDVLRSMHSIIEERPQAGTMKKLSELLRGFSIGLNNNISLDVKDLLSYVFEILNSYLDQVLAHQTNLFNKEAQQKANNKRPPNCLLLAPEPKRLGEIIKVSSKSRVSIFVEYALQLFCDVLKNRCSTIKDGEDMLLLLDLFVPLLTSSLSLKYERIISLSLRSLIYLIKYPLKQLSAQIQKIVDRLFVVLSEYSGMGNTPGFIELSQLLFKCFAQMIRTSPSLTLTSRKVKILLNFAEIDILDSHKQATAFDLVKAIIGKKIVDEKVDNMVEYLSEIVINSNSANIREQGQKTIILYLTAHPTGRTKMEKQLEFFLCQTEYEFEAGKISALQMLIMLMDVCTEQQINGLSLLIFIKLATSSVNEKSEVCRNFIYMALRKLLILVNESALNEIFSVAKDWFDSDKDNVRFLSLKMFAEFARCFSEKKILQKKLVEIAHSVMLLVVESEFLQSTPIIIMSASIEFLTVLMEPSRKEVFGNVVSAKKNISKLGEILISCLNCSASNDLQRFSSLFLDRIVNSGDQVLVNKFNDAFEGGYEAICRILCIQLGAKEVDHSLGAQAVKSLAVLMVSLEHDSFIQIAYRLEKMCWKEIVRYHDQANRRLSVFKLVAVCLLKRRMDAIELEEMCRKFMPIIYREMNRKSVKNAEELYQLAMEVADIFKSKLGEKSYSSWLALCEKEALLKREERRTKAKALAVLDPAKEALRKQKKHQGKKITKKRKLDELKPYRVTKRRRREEIQNSD